VGIESDLKGAELAVLAWLSQDQSFIEHVRRNNLPEDHPDHYDIHSQQAVRAFRLTGIEPTKHGMKAAGKSLRVAAKNVNFGIPYGRGAEAIARQCKEEAPRLRPKSASR
jgi:DNA polymerase I-like protein with 3'-5' exonuclease and polymerase domains